MLRATSPVCDFSGLRPAVLSPAVPCSIVGRYRAFCNAAGGTAVGCGTVPGSGHALLDFVCGTRRRGERPPTERSPTDRSNRGPSGTTAWIAHRPNVRIGCLRRMFGRCGRHDLSATVLLRETGPGRPFAPGLARGIAARRTSTRSTRSLLSGRGPARPTPLDLSQVTDFSYGYPEL
jgi:hypothetical protein